MKRRSLLRAMMGLPLVVHSSASRSGEVRAHLSLERRAGWANTCVACIPGELFAADTNPPKKLCDTIELSFEDNTVGASAIPSGIYQAIVRTDRTKAWMTDEITEWRLELLHVPGRRRAIQFHYGKDSRWSRGCIIIGENSPLTCARSDCAFSDSPRAGMKALRDYVMGRLSASDDLVEVSIL